MPILSKKKQKKLNDELLEAIIDRKDPSIIQLIIKNGADINFVNKDGETPLHVACYYGHLEITKFLIENGADINCVNNNGETPLHYACYNGYSEIVKFLIENGFDVNCASNDNDTPLHLACYKGHRETALVLITNRANVNYANKDNITALHFACYIGSKEIVMALIENRADVNFVDNYGETPIQVAVRDNHIAVINILFELGADVLVLNQEFINKYRTDIAPETKNLIAKITQAENIKKRDEALKSKKDSLITSEVPAKIQPEITANTTTTETQEQLSTLGSKITEIQAQQEKLINSNQLQIKDLKSAIDHQLASTKQLASASSHNINPRFRIKPQDLQEIKYIQDNPELNDYYLRMQKSFNEAFLFATIVSHGGTTIEENSRIANNIEKLSEYVGDIPFASLIITQIKNTATAISKAKTIGKQANFSDIIFTADGIESSLFSERIARRFTISRELNDQLQHQITPNKSQIKDKSRMDKMKIYLKEQARKFGKKYLKLSQNLERGFLGQELSPTNQLALSDFEKAIEFIFNEGIDETIRKTRDETERHQAIIKEIIANSIALEIKELKEEKEVSETKDTKEYNIATQSSTKNSISSTSQTTQRENPTITTNSISEEIMLKMQAEIQALRERDEIREKEMQENQQKLSKLEEEIKRKDEEKRKEDEERKKSEEERKKRDEERERKIKEMYDNQQKLKKLTEIADIAPNIEITIGQGTEAQKVKLGKLMKEFEKNKSNDEKNLSDILHYIISQLEELGFRIGEVEDARPTNRVKKNKAVCFASKDCVIS